MPTVMRCDVTFLVPTLLHVALLRPQAFELCESLNAVGAVLDLHKLLENRKALPESKMAVLEALGDISKAAGTYDTCVVRSNFSNLLMWSGVGKGRASQGEGC